MGATARNNDQFVNIKFSTVIKSMKSKPKIIVQLVHIDGPLKGQIQEFANDTILIGRHPSCQVRFPADFSIISRKHASIIREGNRFKFKDHSANGTFVNGKKVNETILKDGDVFIFAKGGPKVSFLTQVTDIPIEAESESPIPEPEGSPVIVEEEKPAEKILFSNSTPASNIEPERGGIREINVETVKMPLSIVYGPTLRSFNELPVHIGKNPGCDFIINLPQIYDHHAKVFFHDDTYWVKDLTGKQMVTVDGQPAIPQAELKPQSRLALTSTGPDFEFLGQGRLVERERKVLPEQENPPSLSSDTDKHPDKDKKGFSIKNLWKR